MGWTADEADIKCQRRAEVTQEIRGTGRLQMRLKQGKREG